MLYVYAKTKISAFVFDTWIVYPLYYLNSTFQASSNFLWLYIPIVSTLIGNSEDRFCRDAANLVPRIDLKHINAN